MTRFGITLTAYCAVAAIVIPAFVRPAPRLVWNASASVPVGLYLARPGARVERGDLVAATPPEPIAQLMAARGYLPLGTPMLKHVAAVSGQRVCRAATRIMIDGKAVAGARLRDRRDRSLPAWTGCRLLGVGEVFLLNPASPDSFDGRYFGPLPARSIVARLDPLWISNAPEGASDRSSERRELPSKTDAKGNIP